MKIGIIDNGFDLDALGDQAIIGGRTSFSSHSSGRLKPSFSPSTGQGTDIARRIREFYRKPNLFVARVDSGDANLRTIVKPSDESPG